MSEVFDKLKRGLRRPTLIGWLAIAAIVTVTIALFLPAQQWVADGSLKVPVRVIVFDAIDGIPIVGARVVIFHAPPWMGWDSMKESRDRYNPTKRYRSSETGETDDEGTAVIHYEFRTSSSNSNPTPKAHLRWAWVHVDADGYGEVVVPVRHESAPTKDLKTQGEIAVPIGLISKK